MNGYRDLGDISIVTISDAASCYTDLKREGSIFKASLCLFSMLNIDCLRFDFKLTITDTCFD